MVMRAGRVTGMLNRAEATEERVMQLMAASSKTSSANMPQSVAQS